MSRVSIALVVVALMQSAQPVRERYLDAAQLQDFLVRTPLESRVLQYAVGRRTAAANAPYGLELEPEPPQPLRVARRSSDASIRLDIGAVTLGEGMDQLLLHAPAYRWYEAAGVINVQPRGSGTQVPSWIVRSGPSRSRAQRPVARSKRFIGSSTPNTRRDQNILEAGCRSS